jgi:chromosome segregation ATPase
MEDPQVRIAVLEQKFEDMKPVILRIESAITKLSEVNTTVSRMLAVQEERISNQEEIDTVLFEKIDKLRDKMDSDHENVLARLRQLEKRVWMIVGAVTVISFGLNNPLVVKFLTPPATGTTIPMSEYRI